MFVFTQGAFPKPPDFSELLAFDLAFFASHPRFTLFAHRAGDRGARGIRAAVGARAGVLGPGPAGADDPVHRRRYFREVWLVQLGGWSALRAFWFLL